MRSDAGFIRAHPGKSRNRLRGRGKGQNLLFTFLHILPSPRSSPPSGCFPGHFPDGVHRWRSDPTIPLVGSRRIGRALCPAAPVDVTAAKSVRVVPAERQNTHDPTRARPARSSGSSEHRSRKHVLLKRRVTFGAIREKDCREEDREVVRYPRPNALSLGLAIPPSKREEWVDEEGPEIPCGWKRNSFAFPPRWS